MLFSLLAESHEFSNTDQSVKIVSKPHPLNQQEDGTLAFTVICEEDVIPFLDSTLLAQVSTHVVQ